MNDLDLRKEKEGVLYLIEIIDSSHIIGLNHFNFIYKRLKVDKTKWGYVYTLIESGIRLDGSGAIWLMKFHVFTVCGCWKEK